MGQLDSCGEWRIRRVVCGCELRKLLAAESELWEVLRGCSVSSRKNEQNIRARSFRFGVLEHIIQGHAARASVCEIDSRDKVVSGKIGSSTLIRSPALLEGRNEGGRVCLFV